MLLLAAAVFLALPLVLAEGAEVFLPLTAALVLNIMLSPLADWLSRLGLPNWLASLFAVLFVPVCFSLAAWLVIQPSLVLLGRLPALTRAAAQHLDGLRGGFTAISRMAEQLAAMAGHGGKTEVVLAGPTLAEQLAFATPAAMFQITMALLLTFFLLEARYRMRQRLLLERTDFNASLRAARVLRDVQDMVGTYVHTALLIAAGMGVLVGLITWAFGLESPVMWGGLAAVLNLLPYFGPIVMVALLAGFGLGTEGSLLAALGPSLCYLGLHLAEANFVSPMVIGRRMTLSPIAILVSMSYFSWVWGVTGIVLAVPLLLILTGLLAHLGRPNVIGFLFGESLFQPAQALVVEDADSSSAADRRDPVESA